MYSQPGFGLPALSVFIHDELFAFKSYNLFLLSRYSNGSLPPILITSKLVTYPYINIIEVLTIYCGTRWRSWLRHCATSRKVAGSIPDCVIGIFY